MRASTPSLVSLSQFAQVLGLDPLHFAGGYSDLRPTAAKCHDVWTQYHWQDPGKTSREQVARVLAEAEEDLARQIGYWPAPKWIVDERHKAPRAGLAPLVGGPKITADWGYVQYGGMQAVTEISASSVERKTDLDADGDGFAELARFHISNVPTSWNLWEIRACFKEYLDADAANCRTDLSSESFDEAWEVRPLRLERSGTTVKAFIPVWHLFKPQLYEELDPDKIDADDTDSYVDTISFYRVYNDVETQAQFLWGTNTCYDYSCAWASQDGCLRVVDPRQGIVGALPATYDSTTGAYTATSWTQGVMPDTIRLWYRSGLEWHKPGLVDPTWARTVVMLACARLDWPICTCSNAKTLVERWRDDAALVDRGKGKTYVFPMTVMDNPFGTRVGEILAWQKIKAPRRRKGRAVIT